MEPKNDTASLFAFGVAMNSAWWGDLWQAGQALAAPTALLVFVGSITAVVAKLVTKSLIEGTIQHKFSKELEQIKAELHRAAEEFRSETRLRESEISSLHSSLLSGRAQRLSLLDKRRVEAVEAIWMSVGELAAAKGFSGFMSILNLPEVRNRSKNDPKIREFIKSFMGSMEVDGKPNLPNRPTKDQLFVSPLAWAYYVAYYSICAYYYLLGKMMVLGEPDIVDKDNIQKILVAAIPEARDHVAKWGETSLHFWLETLEERLLSELKRHLEDPSVDQERARQAKEIMSAVSKIDEESRKQIAPTL